MLAMQTDEAAQYNPRRQSPAEKQAMAEPALQSRRIPGKMNRLGTIKVCPNTPIGGTN
jgi:hypothetical protein